MTPLSLTKDLGSPRLRRGLLLAASFGLFVLGWEGMARVLNSLLMPGFFETMAALARLLGTGELWQALWVSNQAMVMGFAASTLIGTSLGLLMGRWPAAERFIDPYLNILLVLPMSALIPIMIMATGLGLFTRVLIVFSFSVVMITVNVRAGLRTLEPGWVEMARVFGANELQLWAKVLLPGALPAILTGLRLGLIRSVSGMITVELLLLALGIGRMILDFQGSFQSANLYATILVVVAEAVLLLQIFRRIERWGSRWAESGTSR
jgi:NitT/TauT family transport system permease protein